MATRKPLVERQIFLFCKPACKTQLRSTSTGPAHDIDAAEIATVLAAQGGYCFGCGQPLGDAYQPKTVSL